VTKEYPKTWNKGDEPYYPMNNEQNNDLYRRYQELAKTTPNVVFGGRLGMYKYYDMHQVIAAALVTINKEFNEKD
jgi:UDP-galactopyranose mutase